MRRSLKVNVRRRIEIRNVREIRRSIGIKIKKGKENARKKKRKERNWSMHERSKERMILVIVRTVMILVMMKIKSLVYLMSLFLMKIILFTSQCMIRLRHGDLVLKPERRRKQENRKKLSISLLNLKLSGRKGKKRRNLWIVRMSLW